MDVNSFSKEKKIDSPTLSPKAEKNDWIPTNKFDKSKSMPKKIDKINSTIEEFEHQKLIGKLNRFAEK